MTLDEIRSAVFGILRSIAPEVDLSTVAPAADLRDALDIDSMDFLRLVVLLDERLGVAVPEVDYPRVRSLDGCIGYLAERGASPRRAPVPA
jgi:acyl carrier protein